MSEVCVRRGGLWGSRAEAYETEFRLSCRCSRGDACVAMCSSVCAAFIMGNVCVNSWGHIPMYQHTLTLCFPYTNVDVSHHLLSQLYFLFFS